MAPRLSPPMNGAYFNGLDQPNGLNITLANIPGSPTTDYLLISLNVASGTKADINYGWNLPCLLASNNAITPWTRDHLCKVVSTGVAQGKCKRVWLVIGGASNGPQTDTFTNIQTILTTGGTLATGLLANFGAIFAAIKNINGVESVGFDMDYEEGGDLASVVANVTIALWNHIYNSFRYAPPITFCPSFDLQQNWIDALKKIYSNLKINNQPVQPVVGYNLQCYAGGAGNNPKDWADYLKTNAAGTGVSASDAAAFIWPIVSRDPCAQPDICSGNVADRLKNWNGSGFHSQGASLWCVMPSTLTDYGEAIAKGLA